jgi:4-alpha-glucanotransferase
LVNPLKDRRAGVLLHPTSLPGTDGQGGLGPAAFRFVDFLRDCGFSIWQTLPLGPTHSDLSPYQTLSVHAGNTRLISRVDLVTRGWLDVALQQDDSWLQHARQGFHARATTGEQQAYREFRSRHAAWLDDYALFQAIRQTRDGKSWLHWPARLRNRHQAELDRFRGKNRDAIEQVCFEQFVFFMQWHGLREYAHRQGVFLIGDIPIYAAHDSADVWSNRSLFSTDKDGHMDVVAGVPPDYFSENGQRWGNPLYRWDRMKATGFAWWIERFRTQLELFDLVRLDHFRGFEKYWEIPAAEETAVNGRWVEGPGAALFEKLVEVFGELPLVAEDLGIITPEVDALRLRFNLPGMKILQFAFDGGPDNPYLPHNHERMSVVYTGTHDNDTTLGWYEGLDKNGKQAVRDYLGDTTEPMPWPVIRAAFDSVSALAIVPLQDILALDSTHRMNTPGTGQGNWKWQFAWDDVPANLPASLHRLLHRYGRIVDQGTPDAASLRGTQ